MSVLLSRRAFSSSQHVLFVRMCVRAVCCRQLVHVVDVRHVLCFPWCFRGVDFLNGIVFKVAARVFRFLHEHRIRKEERRQQTQPIPLNTGTVGKNKGHKRTAGDAHPTPTENIDANITTENKKTKQRNKSTNQKRNKHNKTENNKTRNRITHPEQQDDA